MTPFIQLEPSTILMERPFTHPDKSREDMPHLGALINKLRQSLSRVEVAAQSPSVSIEWQGADPPDCRIVIANAQRLRGEGDLKIVGFFGHRRAESTLAATLDEIDEALIGEFIQHPGVLSYCSQQLADGNWGNLVVLSSAEAGEHWRTSARHAYAVRELAPQHYRTIRLHNALLTGGLFSGNALVLQRTKYYDFHDQPAWLAVREF